MPTPTYTSVMKLGLLGTISNLLSKEDTFSRCSVCGALVDAVDTHTAWHAALDTVSATAANALATAQAVPLYNTCAACKSLVAAYDMQAHLMFHVRRSRSDPIETPGVIFPPTPTT